MILHTIYILGLNAIVLSVCIAFYLMYVEILLIIYNVGLWLGNYKGCRVPDSSSRIKTTHLNTSKHII